MLPLSAHNVPVLVAAVGPIGDWGGTNATLTTQVGLCDLHDEDYNPGGCLSNCRSVNALRCMYDYKL